MMKKYIGIVMMLCYLVVGISHVSATETLDTLCYGVDEGIIMLNDITFVQCLDGYVLQPMGGSIKHVVQDLTISDTLPDAINDNQLISPTGTHNQYGAVYRYVGDEDFVASTASYTDTTVWIYRFILLVLVVWALYILARKHTPPADRTR